jgi:hypothetical protein
MNREHPIERDLRPVLLLVGDDDPVVHLPFHQQRIDHLKAGIDRSTRELRLHELIRDLAENSKVPEAMRSLVEMRGVESARSNDVRDFLAERGVSVPTELDIRVLRVYDEFSVVATYRDDWFPADLSWSSKDGFHGRIVNYSWREEHATTAAEGA